jgi:hypothetical protein
MKRNHFAAYDFIRQGKFKTPEKIATTEKLIEQHDVVVNWWCRQSGKTLTTVKIARDLVVSTPNSHVLIISPKMAITHEIIKLFGRAIDKNEIESTTNSVINLKNGSIIVGSSSLDHHIENANLIIVDEFEFIDIGTMHSLVNRVEHQTKPKMILRLIEMFKFKKKTVPQKFIFSSSMKNGENFSMLKKVVPSEAITYLNWEKLNVSSEKIEGYRHILGHSFKKEYDSYKPE